MKTTSLKLPAPSKRGHVLAAQRNLKMARSAHAYVRGNTEKFYEWLSAANTRLIPQGPPIWICGDCHLGNLGPGDAILTSTPARAPTIASERATLLPSPT